MKNEYLQLLESLKKNRIALEEGAVTDFLKKITNTLSTPVKVSSLQQENQELKKKLSEMEKVIQEFMEHYPVASLKQFRKPSQEEKNYITGKDDDLSIA